MRTVALPRRRAMALAPRPGRSGAVARLIRTVLPTNSNSTSVLGNNPAFSRNSTGIVTWPLEVIRIVVSLLLVRVILLRGDAKGIHSLWKDRLGAAPTQCAD